MRGILDFRSSLILFGVQTLVRTPIFYAWMMCDEFITCHSSFITPYFPARSFAAFNNPTNKGCGFIGRDKNSGWN